MLSMLSCSWIATSISTSTGLILNWVDDPYARKSLSVVCKQWLRVEGLTRLSIRVLDLDSFRGFLPRFPNLVNFECSRRITDDDLRFLAQTCPKIEALNLNLKPPRENSDEFDQPCDDVGDDGLCALAIVLNQRMPKASAFSPPTKTPT
ncbi:hypothetical protein CIPAW_16G053300 [Carya illinoinensis]|uniref:COI1 F-box domain-containing protein n=1 Tax=Carya illinoinensis TaxID=32201 RepID=A0A8T1N4L4_CARIL|nr:hypothetical protein CIPAW_16G053300 [Carya illinoinensis]